MYLFTVVLHVFLSLFLIVVILLQPGKGGDVGGAFGGGLSSGAMFGPRGAGNLLTRTTSVVAVLFMATSISLALYSNKRVMADSDVSEQLEQLEAEERGTPEPAPVDGPGAAG